MAIDYTDLTPEIGALVHNRPEDIIQPGAARALRELLRQKGVLVFKELNLPNEQQVRLASMIGTVREEGEKGIFKITLDTKINPGADYLSRSAIAA